MYSVAVLLLQVCCYNFPFYVMVVAIISVSLFDFDLCLCLLVLLQFGYAWWGQATGDTTVSSLLLLKFCS